MRFTPRIILLAVLLSVLIILFILITRDFDQQAMTSIYIQVEGFEGELEIENASKITDIYNRLGIQSANISQLKARVDDYEPIINQMREREANIQKQVGEASKELKSELKTTIQDNMALTDQEAQQRAIDQEKEQIKTRVALEQQREKELSAVEGYTDISNSPEVLAFAKYTDKTTKEMTKEDKELIEKEYADYGIYAPV